MRYHVIERINEGIEASQSENRTNTIWEPTHHHIEIPLFEQWVKERAIKI
jgi:hypothetical protein